MTRPVDIVVTGFTKNVALCAKSLETPRLLRREGLVRAIRYVTWDGAEFDPFVAPVAAMDDVELTRVKLPPADGCSRRKNVVYQMRNLEAVLARVPEDDALVVKTRLDVIVDADFLRTKIRDFDSICRIDESISAFGAPLPRAPFRRKIWLPWADANQPFFYEDAVFAGLKRDLAYLVTPDVAARLDVLDDPACAPFAHVVRYSTPFLEGFPIFRRYVANYGVFANDLDYRKGLLEIMLDDPFFWHLIVANAWILYSAFHVDAGLPGEISFYPNTANIGADWSNFASLANAPPYDDVAEWRQNALAGVEVFSGVGRRFGRLMDDAWPRALFTRNMPDIPAETIRGLAQSLVHYETGALDELEDALYEKLKRYHRENWPPRLAGVAA